MGETREDKQVELAGTEAGSGNGNRTTEAGQGGRFSFISLRVKLLVGFTLLFTIVFAAAFYWFSTFAEKMAMGRIEEDLKTTLVAAAAGLNGDDLAALVKEGAHRDDGFTDDPRYWQEIAWLDTVHNIEPRAWPYSYVKGDKEKEIIFVSDLWVKYNKDKAGKFLESYIPGTYIAWHGFDNTTLYMTIYSDPWGSWVSGYTPVKDSRGNIVGALGIDFRADYVDQVKQGIRDSMVTAFGITYATLFVMVFLISGTLTHPIIVLTKAAERIGEGDYEQDLSRLTKGRFSDEIGTLARVFEIMVSKVYEREQSLIRTVQELKIEIDEVKRQKQVSEIVDSDFFQDLRSKAQAMRTRSPRKEQGDA
jgi:HAMP domain-containing protein